MSSVAPAAAASSCHVTVSASAVASTLLTSPRHRAPSEASATSSTYSGRPGQPGPCTGVSRQAPSSVGPAPPATSCQTPPTGGGVLGIFSACCLPAATPNRTADNSDAD